MRNSKNFYYSTEEEIMDITAIRALNTQSPLPNGKLNELIPIFKDGNKECADAAAKVLEDNYSSLYPLLPELELDTVKLLFSSFLFKCSFKN